MKIPIKKIESPPTFCSKFEQILVCLIFSNKQFLLKLFLWTCRTELLNDCQLFHAQFLRAMNSCFLSRKSISTKCLSEDVKSNLATTPAVFSLKTGRKKMFQTLLSKMLSWKIYRGVYKPAAKTPPKVRVPLSQNS